MCSFETLPIPATEEKLSTKFAGPGRTVSRAVVGAYPPLTPFRGAYGTKSTSVGLEERRGSMTKAAIVTLADPESNEGLSRMVNALTVAEEFSRMWATS